MFYIVCGVDFVLMIVCVCVSCRAEHFTGANVHIGDSAAEPARWAGHRQPTGGHRGPIALSGAGHRADPWYRRRVAPTTR